MKADVRPADEAEGGNAFKRLAWQSALYTLANGLSKAAGLFLLKIQTDPALLPTEQYGLIALLTAVVNIGGPILSLSLPLALLHILSTTRDPDRDAAAFTTFACVLVLVTVVGGVGVWQAGAVGAWLFDTDGAGVDPALFRSMGLAVVLATAFEAMAQLGYVLAQIRERVVFYSATLLSRFGVIIAANVLLVVWMGRGLEGALWAMTLAGGAGALVMNGYLLATTTWRIDWGVLQRMLRYSAPLMVNSLAIPFLYAGDRFLMERLASATALGIYDLAARLASVLNVIVVQGFQSAFNAIGLKEHGATGGGALHRRTFRHYVVFGGGFALGLSLFAGDTLALLIDSDGQALLAAEPFVFPLALGFVGYGLYIIASNILLARAKTRTISLVVLVSALLNLGLNLVLIPRIGAMGASLATLASYTLLAVGAGLAAQKSEGIRFRWEHLGGVLLVVCVLYATSRPVLDWPLASRLAGLAGLMALYPLGVLLVRVYSWAEVMRGAAMVRNRIEARRRR